MRKRATITNLGTMALSRLTSPILGSVLLKLAADIACARGGPFVRATEVGLNQALGDSATPSRVQEAVQRAIRAHLLHKHELWQLARQPDELATRLVANVEIAGLDRLESSRHGNGAVLALPHMYGMELAGAYLALRIGKLVAVTSRPQVIGLSKIYRVLNMHTGLATVTVDPAQRSITLRSVRALRQQLSNNGLVCMLADQYLGGPIAKIVMFDRDMAFSAAPAVLALQAKAPLHPVTLWRDGAAVHCEVHPPASEDHSGKAFNLAGAATAMMQYCAKTFESALKQRPEDWQLVSLLAAEG